MRRIIFALVLALTTPALSVLPALAGNPHFVTLSATRSGNTLIITGKEAGLGDEQQVNIQVNASASCINPGGNHPKALNKESIVANVLASGLFTSDKNGNIVGSLSITPPGPGSFSCPSGQTRVLASVSYTNVKITDATNNASQAIPGTFARTFYSF